MLFFQLSFKSNIKINVHNNTIGFWQFCDHQHIESKNKVDKKKSTKNTKFSTYSYSKHVMLPQQCYPRIGSSMFEFVAYIFTSACVIYLNWIIFGMQYCISYFFNNYNWIEEIRYRFNIKLISKSPTICVVTSFGFRVTRTHSGILIG